VRDWFQSFVSKFQLVPLYCAVGEMCDFFNCDDTRASWVGGCTNWTHSLKGAWFQPCDILVSSLCFQMGQLAPLRLGPPAVPPPRAGARRAHGKGWIQKHFSLHVILTVQRATCNQILHPGVPTLPPGRGGGVLGARAARHLQPRLRLQPPHVAGLSTS
jgi:hypothetical protein